MVKKRSRSYVGRFGTNTFGSRGGSNANQDVLMPGQLLALPPDLPLPDSAKATLQDVRDMVFAHVEYKSGVVSGNTPRKRERVKFDDLTEYDVTEVEERALWDYEAKRLHGVVQNMGMGGQNQRLKFEAETLFPEADTVTAYRRLAHVADQVLFNMHICRHDNSILLQQNAEQFTTHWEYRNSQKILEDRLERINKQKERGQRRRNGEKMEGEDESDSDDSDGSEGDEENEEDARPAAQTGGPDAEKATGGIAVGTREFMVRYCAFVDYLTATAARLAISAADHAAWQSRALSGLAKYSAKLKILARDAQEYAERSLEYGRNYSAEKKVLQALGATRVDLEQPDDDDDDAPYIIGGLNGNGQNNGQGQDRNTGGGPFGMGGHPRWGGGFHMDPIYEPRRQRELEAFLETSKRGGDSYFADLSRIENWTSSTLLTMLQELKGSSSVSAKMAMGASFAEDALDICSVVYRGGTMETPLSAFVHQDRGGDLSGSSRPLFVKHSYQGFKLFRDAVEELRERNKRAALAAGGDPDDDTNEKDKGKRKGSGSSSESSRRAFVPAGAPDAGAPDAGAGPALPTGERPSGTRVTAHLQVLDGDGDPDIKATTRPVEMPLTTLGQIIAVMVPLMCTQPTVINELQTALQGLGEMLPIDVDEDFRPRAPEYTAVAALRTLTYDQQSSSSLPGADFRSLSRSLVAQTHRHAAMLGGWGGGFGEGSSSSSSSGGGGGGGFGDGSNKRTGTNAWDAASAEQRQQRVREARRRQERLAKESSEWVVEERTVRVRCTTYVYSVLAICAVLVVGGLMIGVFLGRAEENSIALQNVDPFGITTYMWVVAGFIMLIAKSIRVNEWPWRDFLLQRVTCHSLSELQAVTGIDAQALLVHLLTTESENVLVAAGPYNKVFARRGAAGEGFKVDIKPEIRTLLAAGLVFVKVSTHHEGTALVCLDLRSGGGGSSGSSTGIGSIGSAGFGDGRTAVRHQDMSRDSDIMCRYLPRSGDRVQDLEISSRNAFVRWRKVLGVYHSHGRKIR
ncbi:uncharacterized protein SPSK_01423 [Sporothrix schenckii 1099-18]|uniref:Uncharacterized protein n=2 Tax=Sporothrix schenckii TaxID=29908 RepID=U7PMR0_SPOS1|nr:uncharacterized protein SPSK_01423 [Sporothrix schenckii 1099-18]ERS96231.1 hypothetical protein HMPREF1624_07140 [Sporothrix schenckii ATCC 58251]KJR86915.1 hypothetical protein SPSK_01423 [Sporothrix schenckii 1099-18]